MKLIRSKYKDIIPSDELLIEDNDKQRLLFLRKKLEEEVQELIDSKYKDITEYADVIQVLEDLAKMYKMPFDEVMLAKAHKKIKLGDFSEGVYLIK